jgi:HD-GYP domain-containing protein (c-di-GMP phosphodiesterase class II)
MRGDQDHLIPLLRLKGFDQYTTTHAMNVSVLAMSLSEFLQLGESEIRTFGIAGLLHDLGKVTVPPEILNKSGRLTDEERAIMNRHPAEGARIILETERNLDLAAVVAYEHHIKLNGEGYPSLRYPRRCHQASDLIHVCDVFDALRTHRPYREAWETERILQYIERGAGREFDPDLALSFVRMMRAWDARVADIENRAEPVLVAGHEEEDQRVSRPEPGGGAEPGPGAGADEAGDAE